MNYSFFSFSSFFYPSFFLHPAILPTSLPLPPSSPHHPPHSFALPRQASAGKATHGTWGNSP